MRWQSLFSSKRFLVALVALLAAVWFAATGEEIDQEALVEALLVLAGAAGVLLGYVAKEKRRE